MVLIQVQPGSLSSAAPEVAGVGGTVGSTAGAVASACSGAAGAAGHPAVASAVEAFGSAGELTLAPLGNVEQATGGMVGGAATSYTSNDSSVMGAGAL